jgi:hypothetical protein
VHVYTYVCIYRNKYICIHNNTHTHTHTHTHTLHQGITVDVEAGWGHLRAADVPSGEGGGVGGGRGGGRGWEEGGGGKGLVVMLETCGLKGMEKLFIERVRINECLSLTCLAIAGLVQRTKPSLCCLCLSPTCLALRGLVQRTKQFNELNLAHAAHA